MSPSVIGFLRALGVVILTAVLSYLGDASHLNGVVSTSIAALISAIALGLEHSIEEKKGTALFGAVRTR